MNVVSISTARMSQHSLNTLFSTREPRPAFKPSHQGHAKHFHRLVFRMNFKTILLSQNKVFYKIRIKRAKVRNFYLKPLFKICALSNRLCLCLYPTRAIDWSDFWLYSVCLIMSRKNPQSYLKVSSKYTRLGNPFSTVISGYARKENNGASQSRLKTM